MLKGCFSVFIVKTLIEPNSLMRPLDILLIAIQPPSVEGKGGL
jgi:hypothetical protein